MKDLQQYFRPKTVEEAVALKQEWGRHAVYLGGGTDLLVHRPPEVHAAIDIRHCGMSYVRDDGDSFVIGGGALLRDAESKSGRVAGGMLTEAVRETAPWLIRNAATLTGNIANASPAADAVPALLVLDANLLLLGESREIVPLCDVLLAPHKTSLGNRLVVEIQVPHDAAERRGAFIKLARSKSDIALVNLAISLRLDGKVLRDVRVALGAVAPTIIRARGAELALEGEEPCETVLARAVEAVKSDIRPISDWRASAEYRTRMSGVLLRRAIAQATAGGGKGSTE